MTGQEYVQ